MDKKSFSKKIDYKIVIPSYKRPETLLNKTLGVLQKYQIPREKIYIFVGNKTEKKRYQKIIPDYLYHEMIVGKTGMKNIRNFITKYFPEGEFLFNIDDDITRIVEVVEEVNISKKIPAKLQDLQNLDEFIQLGFKLCLKNGLKLFGIYPAFNGYFLRKNVSFDLKYIIGSMWGCINDHKLIVHLDDKEDFERTIQRFLMDDGVVRFNNISVKSSYYKEKGGMQITRTPERILKSAKWLQKKYPELVKIYIRPRTGLAEIRLRNKRNKKSKPDVLHLN